jgi:F-type H+-transporting ATPase subunit a
MQKYLFRKRYAFFLLVAAGVLVMLYVPPVVPIVQLPAENLPWHWPVGLPLIGGVPLTNTFIAMVIVDIILVLLGLYLWRANKRMVSAENPADQAPKGLHNMLEAVFEYLWNQTEQTAGTKWASFVFPIVMTIILLVVVSNWMELVPGIDSVGILEPAHEGEGYEPVQLTGHIGPIPPIYYLNGKNVQPVEAEEGGEGEHAEEGEHHGVCEEACVVLPFVRVLSTDLNFTLSLAIVAVVMTQFIGFRALGLGYLGKFFNFSTIFTEPLGLIDVIVGALELVSELARLLSFSFRLLGNIFAGSILLFVISSLVPPFAPWIFAFLELFVGAIQAYVFGMLTLTFMSMATIGHGHDDDH